MCGQDGVKLNGVVNVLISGSQVTLMCDNERGDQKMKNSLMNLSKIE